MNPSSKFHPSSLASFPHHHIHHLCPRHHHIHHLCPHHHHHHHGCHHHHHHHHFNCHAHLFHSNLAPPPPPLQNPEPESSYPSQKVSNLEGTANIRPQTSSSTIQLFHQSVEAKEEEGVLEEEDDDDDPVFVLTDEWREFFARSEAKRQLEKKRRAKERRETSGNSFSGL